jgi:hypothetical protein
MTPKKQQQLQNELSILTDRKISRSGKEAHGKYKLPITFQERQKHTCTG